VEERRKQLGWREEEEKEEKEEEEEGFVLKRSNRAEQRN